jgi:hypothetical protein
MGPTPLYIDEPIKGPSPEDNPESPEPTPEPPVENQLQDKYQPLDNIEDVQWLAEDDPRRIEVEKWKASEGGKT